MQVCCIAPSIPEPQVSISHTIDDQGDTRVMAGKHCLANITAATDRDAVSRFISLCSKEADELTRLGIEYEDRRQWNLNSNGKGRNWPIFNKLDRRVDQLLKQAGIINT